MVRKCLIYFCIILVSGVFISSCKTVKTVIGTKKSTSIEHVYDSLKLSEFAYKSLNLKYNVAYEKKTQSMSLKGNIKILKDSIIWVTLSPGLGIEAARLMCTKDSIYYLDKINNSLTKGKYEYIKNLYKIDVDYNSLQAILTNNFFIYPGSGDERKDFVNGFKVSKDSIQLAVYRKSESLVENLINIERSKYKIDSYLINDVPNRRSLTVKYKNSDTHGVSGFPGFININSMNEDKFLKLDIEFTKVTVNEDLTFPFKVPSGYRVIVQ